MAYAFDNLKKTLDEQKSNIFSPTGTDAGVPAAAGMQQSDGSIQKSQAAPGAPVGGAEGSAPSGEMSDASTKRVSAQGGQREALKKSVGKSAAPKLVGETQQNIANLNTDLERQANEYVQNYSDPAKYDTLSDADLDAFAKGDSAASAKVDRVQSNQPRVERFRPNVDLSLPGVDQVMSDEGIARAFRKEGGEQYTAGMGAFDMQALGRDPEFEKLRQSIKESATGLRKKAGDLSESASKTAQERAAELAESARGKLKGGLESRLERLIANQKSEADAEAQRRQSGAGDFVNQQRQAVLDEIQTKDPDLFQYIVESGEDPMQYYTPAGPQSWQEFIDPEEAGSFSRILSALGRGTESGQYLPGRGAARDSFDRDAFASEVIGKARGARDEAMNRAADAKDKANIDRSLEIDEELKKEFGAPIWQTATVGDVDMKEFLDGDGNFDAKGYKKALSDVLATRQAQIEEEKSQSEKDRWARGQAMQPGSSRAPKWATAGGIREGLTSGDPLIVNKRRF